MNLLDSGNLVAGDILVRFQQLCSLCFVAGVGVLLSLFHPLVPVRCTCLHAMLNPRLLSSQIMDNAPIHVSADIFGLLITVLEAVGVRLVLLPKYSPELNPCEMVFAQAKRYLREKRQPGPFLQEIVHAFAAVDRLNVLSYYEHCLYRFDE